MSLQLLSLLFLKKIFTLAKGENFFPGGGVEKIYKMELFSQTRLIIKLHRGARFYSHVSKRDAET
jgi:hypothetical protein